MGQGSSRGVRPPPRDERSAEAQAALDQLRTQAGGALSGDEVEDRLRRHGAHDKADPGEPPLDWRMTPKNILMQVLAVALFIGVVWFMISLMFDGMGSIFSYVTGG